METLQTAGQETLSGVLPNGRPCSAEILAVVCWMKSQKSPLFPGTEGPLSKITSPFH